MDFHGELICPVVTSQIDPDTGNPVPVNPHQIAATRYRLRLSDLTGCPVHDRPLDPNVEEFHAVGTLEAFQAAEAADDIDVLWWESIEDSGAHVGRLKDEVPDRDERRELRRWLRRHGVPREGIHQIVRPHRTRLEMAVALVGYVKSLFGGAA